TPAHSVVMGHGVLISFFFSSRRRHTRWPRDWSSDVCSSDLGMPTTLLDRRSHAVAYHYRAAAARRAVRGRAGGAGECPGRTQRRHRVAADPSRESRRDSYESARAAQRILGTGETVRSAARPRSSGGGPEGRGARQAAPGRTPAGTRTDDSRTVERFRRPAWFHGPPGLDG